MRTRLNQHHDELARRRAEEIDEVIERLAEFSGPPPTKVSVMFESCVLAYAALAAHRGERRTILLGQASYDRAKETGLLAWCAEHYPNLTFEPPSRAIKGCHVQRIILDEVTAL